MIEKKPSRRRAHKKKPTERAILGEVRKLVDPATGEEVKAIVGYYPVDKRELRERGLHLGDVVVMDVYKERNYRFYRLWHQLAKYMVENVDAFDGMKLHPALKRLQLEAGIHCDFDEVDLGSLGKHKIKRALSLNFFDTDETKAQIIWEALCDHVAKEYFATWSDEQVAMARTHWERDTE